MIRALLLVCAWASFTSAAFAQDVAKGHAGARERGARAVHGEPAMNPPVWSARAYDSVWTQWGLKQKPDDFARQFQDRYGLHDAPYDNAGLPMGLHLSSGLFGKGLVNDCLLCHAGTVAGQTIIGVGNASLDLQGLFDDLAATDKVNFGLPFRFSNVRGTIDPINPVTFLMEFRNPDLTLGAKVKLDYSKNVNSDPPAWWLLKRKKTRNWTGGVHTDSIRVDMVNLLTPFNSAEHIQKHETTFADIHAFVMSVEAPKYPFAIDTALADRGRELYQKTCARCHGTSAPGDYPSKVVPLKTLGTDPNLAQALTPKNLAYFNKTWFAQEKRADGGWQQIAETPGYQAPPVDGVWATAPYFHNGSAPTLAHVLDSRSRPRIFTRTFGTAREDYDATRVGWKITVLDQPPAADTPPHLRRRIYDTTLPGQSNAGHTVGDHFSNEERRAVIEYLKTL